MPSSLLQLEAQRTDLFRQLAALADFRRGSITNTSGRCGKPTCHCAKRDDPGKRAGRVELHVYVWGRCRGSTFARQIDWASCRTALPERTAVTVARSTILTIRGMP
jgi:hypothetical protein